MYIMYVVMSHFLEITNEKVIVYNVNIANIWKIISGMIAGFKILF